MAEPPDSATVLNMFYTSVILLLTTLFSDNVAIKWGEPVPELTEDGLLTAASLKYRPIVLILEGENEVLYEHFDDRYWVNSYLVTKKPKSCPWNCMLVANRVPTTHSDHTLVEAANADFFDRFESNTGFKVSDC